MLSKSQIKLIKSLAQKKIRAQHGLFTVEGVKGITEFLNSSFSLEHLYTTEDVFQAFDEQTTIIPESDLKRITTFKNPNRAVALFKIKEANSVDLSRLIVALDDVRDPGNLGTIIRLCDWFGVKDLVCSSATVDCYNPKVIQATMGSLTRVNISYQNLEAFLSECNSTIFGTFMNGENIYNDKLPENGVLIMGNEANGISPVIERLVTKKLAIPRFGSTKETESLNVATATAICLSEFKRRSI